MSPTRPLNAAPFSTMVGVLHIVKKGSVYQHYTLVFHDRQALPMPSTLKLMPRNRCRGMMSRRDAPSGI